MEYKLSVSKLLSAAFAALFALTISSCSDDDLSPVSVFDGGETVEVNNFDNWLDDNYRKVYNIDFKYRYNDKETNQVYNVIPAEYDKSVALAILVKHIWLDAYTEAMGEEFMKTYTPRIIQLIGSYMYNQNESQVLGTAEGGLKIMLYGVNEIDIDKPRINTSNPYESHEVKPIDMNYWFFHTMHHEFCHILTQKKNYNTEFQTISAGKYHSTDWINVKDQAAAPEGFVTGYASGEYNEDFAETYATYVTMTQEGWETILKQAGEEGAATLTKKLDMIKEYFQTSWGVDLDDLREIVLRRSSESTELDLRNLN